MERKQNEPIIVFWDIHIDEFPNLDGNKLTINRGRGSKKISDHLHRVGSTDLAVGFLWNQSRLRQPRISLVSTINNVRDILFGFSIYDLFLSK